MIPPGQLCLFASPNLAPALLVTARIVLSVQAKVRFHVFRFMSNEIARVHTKTYASHCQPVIHQNEHQSTQMSHVCAIQCIHQNECLRDPWMTSHLLPHFGPSFHDLETFSRCSECAREQHIRTRQWHWLRCDLEGLKRHQGRPELMMVSCAPREVVTCNSD